MGALNFGGRLGIICASLLVQPAQAQMPGPTPTPGPPPPSPPPISTPPATPGQFSFQVCNNSGLVLNFVQIFLDGVNGRFHTRGWFVVNAGECPHQLGSFPPGKFYYFAVAISSNNYTQYLVEGTALYQCVQVPAPFDRTDLNTVTCNQPYPRMGSFVPPGNYLAGFSELIVPPAVDTITLSIRPPQ